MQHQEPSEAGASAWDAQSVAAALTSGRIRGVRLWPATPDASALAEGAAEAGWQYAVVDSAGATDKAGYLNACAEQLSLPNYMGRNWDALEESLGDLGVAAATSGKQGLIVVWRHWAELAGADPTAFQVALAVWRSVVADWRARMPGAAVALSMTTEHIDDSDLSESVIDELYGMSRVHSSE